MGYLKNKSDINISSAELLLEKNQIMVTLKFYLPKVLIQSQKRTILENNL